MGKKIKGEGGKDKRKVLGKREETFDFVGILRNSRRRTREKIKERRRRESKIQAKNNLILTKKGNLAFQRVHTIKSSLRVKLEAYQVSSTSKNPLSLSFQGI